jgi:hypothetical protein
MTDSHHRGALRAPDPIAEEIKDMFAAKALLVDRRVLYDNIGCCNYRSLSPRLLPDRDQLIYLNRCQYAYTWRRLAAVYGITVKATRCAWRRGQYKIGLWLNGISTEEGR